MGKLIINGLKKIVDSLWMDLGVMGKILKDSFLLKMATPIGAIGVF
jgi:hypothetical protein